MKGYTRLTEKDRENILVYVQQGDEQKEIANKLSFSQSSISQELAKLRDRNNYNLIIAQREKHICAVGRIRLLLINEAT